MVCYAVPLIAAIAHHVTRKRVPEWKHSTHQSWLTLLLSGGAIFGVIDHLWNGELFLIGSDPVKDLALGVTITATIMLFWVVLVALDKMKVQTPATA